MEIKLKEGDDLIIILENAPAVISVEYCAIEPDRFTINGNQPDSQGRCGILYDLTLDDTSSAESELIAAIQGSQDEDEDIINLGGVVIPFRAGTSVPDHMCHRTGWSARKIDKHWCVGMTGNLDTVHDAVLIVNDHYGDDKEARAIAEFVAQQYNDALGI